MRKNSKTYILDYENSIKKSNQLSMAKLNHGLTLNQLQLLAYAIYSTQRNGKTEFNKADFERKFNIGEYRSEDAKKDSRRLFELEFSLENMEADEFDYLHIFQRIHYKKGLFTFKWSEDIIPHILELKEKFILTDLTITSKFKSSFTWILYDYLKAHYGYWHKPISKDALMRIFGVEDKKTYQKNTGKFKQTVLDVAIAEINEHTELEVWYKEEKKGRTIVGFDLVWSNGQAVASATKSQIKELESILDIVFKDSYQFMKLKNNENRQEAIHIIRELESMKVFTKEPICITKEKAKQLLEFAKYGFRELNQFLEKDGRPTYDDFNWLEA